MCSTCKTSYYCKSIVPVELLNSEALHRLHWENKVMVKILKFTVLYVSKFNVVFFHVLGIFSLYYHHPSISWITIISLSSLFTLPPPRSPLSSLEAQPSAGYCNWQCKLWLQCYTHVKGAILILQERQKW